MSENEQDVCRLCLSKEGLMLPIFRNRIIKNETAFRFKIMSCTSIEVFADDELPPKVCFICVHQVEKFYQFQLMCKNSDDVLHLQMKEIRREENDDGRTEKSEFESEHYKQQRECFSNDRANLQISTCFICTSVFLTHNLLIDHLSKSHPTIESFVCKECKMSFSGLNQFKNHLMLEHSLSCDQCDYVFKNQKNFQDHLKAHCRKTFLCRYCSKVFCSLSDVKKHELEHSERTCNYCLKELYSKEEFYIHAKECLQKHNCKFCEEGFPSKRDLIEHVNNCHASSPVHRCNNCQKTFTKIEDVEYHKCENDREDNFQCKSCHLTFNSETSLINHVSAEHEGGTLTCRFCRKMFTLKSSLRRHEKSHSGLKPYQCKFCPRKFKDSRTCVVHTRTHTGEHPFQCQECHKDFKQLGNLKMHTYRHHKKNQKHNEENTELINQVNYEELYSGDVIDNYPGDSSGSYHHMSQGISITFTQNMNVLGTEQPQNHQF